MTANSRLMRLTPELVALVPRHVEHSGPMPMPGPSPSDADYDSTVRGVLAGVPDDNGVWVFAYGSLIWNPAFDYAEHRLAVAHGWHRSFCLGPDRWFRGSERNPGIMLALDRGGQCKGVVYRLSPDAVEANLGKLVRREMRVKRVEGAAQFPRWVHVRTEEGPLGAITFVINRDGGRYVCGLSPEQIADSLAAAVGPFGSMAEYLYSTVSHLEALGLHDSHLWRLQELVAERIEASAAAHRPVSSTATARTEASGLGH